VGWGYVDWIGLAQDRNRLRALVNSVLMVWYIYIYMVYINVSSETPHFQVQVIMRPMVGRPVRLGVGPLSLTRERVSKCSAITHWLESSRTHNHTLLSHLRLPNLERKVPAPHEEGCPAKVKVTLQLTVLWR
jgi:hypothetical protein